jgi:hypothetical protein
MHQLATNTHKWYQASVCNQPCNLHQGRYTEKILVPINWPTRLDALASRLKSDRHVHDLADSMRKFGIQKHDVVVLVYVEDLEKYFGTYTATLTLNFPVDQTTGLAVVGSLPPVPFNIIAGDHTVAAVLLLHHEKPRRSDFMHIPVTLLICRKTLECEKYARSFGTIDNITKSVHKDMTQWDIAFNLHHVLKQSQPASGQGEDARKHKETVAAQVADIKLLSSSTFAEATFGSIRALASREGELWLLIEAIFQGKFLPPPGMVSPAPPTTLSHFNNMAGIPDDTLQKWLGRVISTQWTTTQFNDRCLKFKKEQKVQKAIAEYLCVKVPSLDSKSTYEELMQVYEFLAQPDWFSGISSWVTSITKKQSLPEQVKHEINTQLDAHNEQVKHKSKQQQLVRCTFSTHKNTRG